MCLLPRRRDHSPAERYKSADYFYNLMRNCLRLGAFCGEIMPHFFLPLGICVSMKFLRIYFDSEFFFNSIVLENEISGVICVGLVCLWCLCSY